MLAYSKIFGGRKSYRYPGVGGEPDPGVGRVLPLLQQLLLQVRVDKLHVPSPTLLHLPPLPPLLLPLPPVLILHPLLFTWLLPDKDLLKVREPKGLLGLPVGHLREAEGCIEDGQQVKGKADHCQAVEYLGDRNADGDCAWR